MKCLATLWWALLLIYAPLRSQHLAVMKEKEPPAIPATKAEPRKKLNSDPVTVFQNLLGPSKDSRRVAGDRVVRAEGHRRA